MSQVNVSIIIPHYNSPKLLRKLLTTVPRRDDFQVIVVDDNTTKGKAELEKVVKEDERCEFYRNDTGVQSAGACRNIGIRHSIGKWILFADADDYFTDDFSKIIDKHIDDDNDVVFFSPTSVFVGTGICAYRHIKWQKIVRDYVNNKCKRNELSLRFMFESPCSKIINSKLIRSNGIMFDELIVSNDIMFSMKVGSLAKKLTACDDVIYVITASSNTLTTKISEKRYDTRLSVAIKRYSFLKDLLPKKDFNSLSIDISVYILQALKWFGLKKVIKVIGIALKNNVSIFNLNRLSPNRITTLFARLKVLQEHNKLTRG